MEENSPSTPPAQASPGQSADSKTTAKSNLYPELIIHSNEHPSRLLAFPVIGYAIRVIAVIPQFLMLFFFNIWLFVVWMILPFVILFTGKYWDDAYNFTFNYLCFSTKLGIYTFGLTDTYPGFNMQENGIFELRYEKPAAPSRFLAFPVLGFLIRIILLIPYIIFLEVLGRGSYIALFCSWFAVLFTGKYPQSLYEFIRDNFRVSIASYLYLFYFSDTYPSFSISMNHKAVKIILLVLGAILLLLSFFPSSHSRKPNSSLYNYTSPSPPITH